MNADLLEDYLDTLRPFNPAGVIGEVFNMGQPQPQVPRLATTRQWWTWAGRVGSFKAPQLRNVELTEPYFHNGCKLTLMQVLDFYDRGGAAATP